MILVKSFVNTFGETRWKFGTPSILKPGTVAWSLRSFKTRAYARRRARA